MADREWLRAKSSEEPTTDSDETENPNCAGIDLRSTWVLCLCCVLATGGLLGGTALFVQRRGSDLADVLKPTWEVTQLTIENIHLPGVKGVVPADTSRCPGSDPCGLLGAKGCSVCPSEKFWNDGCLCRQNAKGGSAPSGEVVEADTSACPSSDPCGVKPSSGACARCPDASFISEGCSCRQPPISAADFFKGVEEFFGALTGATPSFLKMDVEAVVQVKNPASVGAVAEPGIFNVTYKGVQIGAAATPETVIAPSGTADVVAQARIEVVINSETGMQIMQEVVNENQLAVQVVGSALSRCGPFVVRCDVSCDVVMTHVYSAQTTKFPQKDCTYGYTLLPQLSRDMVSPV